MRKLKIGVMGGGVSGLILARLAKERPDLADLRVFEAHDASARAGSGILLGPRAIWILGRLGLESRLREVSGVVGGARYLDCRLETLHRTDLARGKTFAYAFAGIHHADLIGVLRDSESEALGRIVFNKKCERIERDGGASAVTATFGDGDREDFDFIVGADGIGSVVRSRIDPRPPRDSRQIAIRGVVSGAPSFVPRDEIVEALGNRIRVGFLPIGRGRHAWFGVVEGERDWPRERIVSAFREGLAEFPEEVLEFVTRAPVEEWVTTPLADLWPPPKPTAPKLLLIGDAAHPMTPNLGQGVNQAIWDSWWLGTADHGDVEKLQARFSRSRRILVSAIVLGSRWIGKFTQGATIFGTRGRDFLLRIVPGSLSRWIFSQLNRIPSALR